MSSRRAVTVALALTLLAACKGKSNTTEQNQPTSIGPPPTAAPEGSGTDPNKPNPVGAEPGTPMGSASAGPGAGTAPPLDGGIDASPKQGEGKKAENDER